MPGTRAPIVHEAQSGVPAKLIPHARGWRLVEGSIERPKNRVVEPMWRLFSRKTSTIEGIR